MAMTISNYIRLMRPKQWTKNLFVLAPVFFSNNLLNTEKLAPALVAFAAFCMMSSAVYCLNDIVDAPSDRLHATKSRRPIASGAVTAGGGYACMAVCLLLASGILFAGLGITAAQALGVLLAYCMLNVGYCLWLKRIAIVDILTIAIGFVLRVAVGGIVTGIAVSQWLVLMTFLLAMFLALTKRYDDFLIYESSGTMTRKSIQNYSIEFFTVSTAMIAAVALVCYIMYTLSPEISERLQSPYLYLTSFWVTAGIMRFLQNMLVYKRSGSPTQSLLDDRFIQCCAVGWTVSFFIILYV